MKIDLHTHSESSPDGGLTMEDFRNSPLDQIAITDHNKIDFAVAAKKELGDRVIVGEEIMTTDGEIIGLFLSAKIEPGQTPLETVKAIRRQNAIVYIPHPFETVRSGISRVALDEIAKFVDIIEVANGRAYFQNRGDQARAWAAKNNTAMAASSDAHGRIGWGKTYCETHEKVVAKTIVEQISCAKLTDKKVDFGVIYPKLNRLRKKVAKGGKNA